MGRPLRLEYAGALYHITSQINERKKIFLDDELGAKSALLTGLRELRSGKDGVQIT